MRGVSWFSGRLSWRLTLSYVLVTLVAAFTLLFVVTVAATLHDLQQTDIPPDLILAKEGGQMDTYLNQPVANEEALRYWVAIPLFDALSKEQINVSLVAVLDQHGQAVSATACSTTQFLAEGTQRCVVTSTSKVKNMLNLPLVQTLVTSTIAEKGDVTTQMRSLPTGETVLVQPVLGGRKQVTGALMAVIDGRKNLRASQDRENAIRFIVALWNHIPRDGFFFILLAIVAGTMTGLLISRNLAQRLQHIMQAATAWSRGEFQTMLQDASSDEVGQLARNLNRMAEQLQQLLTSWQKLAVVEERNRLARELHDSVKQHVFTNALLVRAARKVLSRDLEKAQRYLQEAEELCEQTQQELIELIQALRPAALAEKGLVPMMRDYLVAWSRRTGIMFELEIQQERTLRLDMEIAIFRIFQEALTNIARHSKAKHVNVGLMSDDELLSLTIQDDGKGFDTSKVSGEGIGLKSMYERIELLSGKLEITSSVQGTIVQARFPLMQDDNEESRNNGEVRNG